MAMDTFKNFAYGLVLIPPTPSNLGTSLTLASGHAARFPAPPFNVSIWPFGVAADPTNAEIARVTGVAGDVFTITRQQEGSAARSILANDQVAQALTLKAINDLKSDILASVSASYALKSYVDTRDNDVMNWVTANYQNLSTPYYPKSAAYNDIGSLAPNIDAYDSIQINALAQSLAIQNPVGTVRSDSQPLVIRIRDNGTPRAISWSAIWATQNQYIALPTTTYAYKTWHLGFRCNALYGKWVLLAAALEP